MLIYKDGRFYAGKASFSIPNGCKINDHPRIFLTNGIALTMPDEAVTLDVNFEFSEGGAETSLKETLAEYTAGKVKARPFPGGTGWCAECKGDLYAYFEVRFDAKTGLLDNNGDAVNTFRIVATAPYGTDIRALRKSPEIMGLINSFRCEI